MSFEQAVGRDRSGPVRVLHVDDDPAVADLTAAFLEREDERFDVDTAGDAGEGLARLAEETFDCVVSDYELPETDGIAFLETVREEYDSLPFILYTGEGSEAVASDAISAGVTDYLQRQSGVDHYTVLANRVGNAVERYRTERAIERARHYFDGLVEEATDAILVVDADAVVRFATPAAESVLGRTPDELVGSNGFDPVHPEDRERVVSGFDALVADPDDRCIAEFRYRRPDDSWLWVEARGRNLLDDPVVEGVVVYVRDVTERKERELRLTEQERRYEAVFEDPNILVGLLDPDGTLLEANRTALDYVDARAAAVTGVPFRETPWFERSEDAREAVPEWVERAARGEYVEFDVELVRPDGDPYEVQGSFRPVTDEAGDVVSILVSARDVTARRERERRLEALNRTNQDLMRADTREEIAEIGVEAARDILGLHANSIHLHDPERAGLVPLVVTDAIYDLVGDPPVLSPGDSIAWRVFERGEATAVDAVHDDPDVYDPASPIQSELFLPIGDHGILLAGSESPEAFDQEDVVLGEILADNVARALEQVERTDQLRARERELTRQNDRLAEFASVVSHDLRNPLNVAQGRLALAREEVDSEHLDDVASAHDRMGSLIEDLLQLAREGEQAVDREPVDLASLARSCWQHVETADATFTAESTRTVRADRTRLQQLLENLLRNAVDHGGPDVSVVLGALDDGFYVEDDGPGIPPEERDAVFDPGYSTAADGTGFGLSIVERVAADHGWSVRVTESEAGGARFEVTGVDVPEGSAGTDTAA